MSTVHITSTGPTSSDIKEGANISENHLFRFPKEFLWGVSTSHFQVEGHPLEIQGRISDWAKWTATDGKINDGTSADRACEFHKRYVSDFELFKSLNCNAFRLSLNWAALVPTEPDLSANKVSLNREVLEYYRDMLQRLKDQGVKTFVTLHHFCTPDWLTKHGAWLGDETPRQFGLFAGAVARELGPLIDYWITLNEPLPYVYCGFVDGIWPPGHKRDYLGAFTCVRKMLEGHARAYHAIKDLDASAQVSFTNHWRPFAAKNPLNPLDQLVRYYRDCIFNHMFPRAIQHGEIEFPFPMNHREACKALSGPVEGLLGAMDFIGVNYYTRDLSKWNITAPLDIFGMSCPGPEYETSSMGWESYPDGLYDILTFDVAPYKHGPGGVERPIFITENGYANIFPANLTDGDWSLSDHFRIRYLTSHLMAVHHAIADGANVKGYLYWSLLDNFEWHEGLKCRFGLVRVTYPTQERALRESAHVYAEIAKRNAVNLLVSY